MAVLGLGLAALGRPGYMTVGHEQDVPDTGTLAMARQAARVCAAAYEAGIRHFDVARSYGRAEQFLRDWLDGAGATGVTVSSKWGYRYTAGWQRTAPVHEEKEHSLARLDAQWPESRTVLGPHLSIYQVHSVTPGSAALADPAILDRLLWLASTGLSLGVSVTGPHQGEMIDRAVALHHRGRRVFDWVQATWNLLETSAAPALARAHAAGVKVIVKEALANGRLSPRGDIALIHALAEARGVTSDALALATALAQPWADVVLSGAATVEQLTANLAARTTPPLDASPVVMDRERYWAERARLPWS